MKADIKVLIQDLVKTQRSDFGKRTATLEKLYSKASRYEKLCTLREDWAEKRIKSILREAERAGVDITKVEGAVVHATCQDVKLIGNLAYETRGHHYRTSIWTRPRMSMRLWYKGFEDKMYENDGEEKNENKKYGGEAISFIFGRQRLMVYNRLMETMLNCMGK